MDRLKLGNFEAVSIILTVVITHAILTLPKSILSESGSSCLLNILYVSIIAFIFCIVVAKLLGKFPGLDIIDISKGLGGSILQRIMGFLFLAYIVFVTAILLRIFANCLQVVYYPMTDLVYIILLFVIGIILACTLKRGSVFKANLIIVPIAVLSIIFLFVANSKYFNFENIFPILGNGINATFVSGTSNLYAFGGIIFVFLLPSLLKKPKQLKKISLTSVVISSAYLLLAIATLLFMFNSLSFENKLIPLYAAVRHIEFGVFFQRLDSIFLLIWILAFFCYFGNNVTFSMEIFKKVTNIKNSRLIIIPFVLLILACSLLLKDEAITKFLESTVYKYLFWIFVIGINLGILVLAAIKKYYISAKKEE